MFSSLTRYWILLPVMVLAAVPAGAQQKPKPKPKAPAWGVTVDFEKSIKPMDPAYASVNVNNALKTAQNDKAFDEAVRALGFRMMRFQGPGGRWDYHKIDEYNDGDFQALDAAVNKACTDWGVQELMFGLHRVKLPVNEEGRYLPEEFPAYAKMCARFVKRYAPPGGKIRVRYWEPFNELDHPGKQEKLKKFNQGMSDIAKLYITCAKAMKAVNPQIRVGGPTLCQADAGALEVFLRQAGPYVDFVSWHDYSTGKATTSDERVLSSVTGNDRFVGGAKKLFDVMMKVGITKPPLFMDEYHVNYHAWKPVDVRTANQFSAVFAASVLANMSDSPVERTFMHDVMFGHYGMVGKANNRLDVREGLVTDKTDPATAVHVRPVGWVYRWFNQYAGGRWVDCKLRIPQADLNTPRGRLLDACAWRNGRTGIVLLVNKDAKAHTVSVRLGMSIPGDGFALPLREMSIANGAPREIRTTATRNGKILRTLPPMSVTFIVFDGNKATSENGGAS